MLCRLHGPYKAVQGPAVFLGYLEVAGTVVQASHELLLRGRDEHALLVFVELYRIDLCRVDLRGMRLQHNVEVFAHFAYVHHLPSCLVTIPRFVALAFPTPTMFPSAYGLYVAVASSTALWRTFPCMTSGSSHSVTVLRPFIDRSVPVRSVRIIGFGLLMKLHL